MDRWDQGRLALRLGIGGLLGALTAMAGFAVGSIFGGRVMPTIVLLLGSSAVQIVTLVRLSRLDEARLSALLNQLVPRSDSESGNRTSDPLPPGEAVQAIEAELRKGRRDRAELQAISLALQPVLEAVGESRVTASEPDLSQILDQFMIELRRETTSLLRLSDEVFEASDRIGKGAGDQADTLTATTTTVEDLSEKIDRISQNAEEATTACFQTRQESKRGRDQLSEVVSGIERLRERVEANGKKARRLGDRSVEIGTIVELINGLAQRTDMLALNATIESVRAGEHGRGFAVVAEEIRKLAERAADATREIGTLVEAIQADVHESVLATAEEQAEMEREAARIHEAGEALERIGAVAERSALLVEGISASATGQVQATQNLVRAMQRMSMVSQATSDAATRSRERVEKLAAHARKLRQLSAASAEPQSPSPAPANCNGNSRIVGGRASRSRVAGVST